MFLIYLIIFISSINGIKTIDQVYCAKNEDKFSNFFSKINKQNEISLNSFLEINKNEQFLRLELIKKKILKNLGLENVPEIDKEDSNKIANDHLIDFLEEEQQDAILRSNFEQSLILNKEINDYKSISEQNTVSNNEELINQIYLFPIKNRSKNKFLFNFTLNSKIQQASFTNPNDIILTLKKKQENDFISDKCLIYLNNQIGETINRYELDINNRLIEFNSLNLDFYKQPTNFLKFNLNKYLIKYLKAKINFEKDLLGVEQLIFINSINCDFDSALLTIDFKKIEIERNKRSVDCEPNGQTSGCCREPFYVNFTTIGWHNWILQPAGYNAYYCKGKCDLSHARYHHTTVLTKFPTLITQCCSPRKMSQISLIYVDEQNLVFKKNLPNMVVESCDCA